MGQDIARLQSDVADLRQKQEDTARALERVLFMLERQSDQWKHEHANLLLKLELELVKIKSGLPPRSTDDDPKLGA